MKPHAFLNTGYKKPSSPPAPEKITTLAASAATPVSYTTDISPWRFPPVTNVFMQNDQPSCLADGVCAALEYKIWKATGKIVRLSRRFLWALCVKNDGVPASEGTLMQTALEMAEKYGVCEASFFDDDTTLPIDTYADATQITPAAYSNAQQYKVASWALLGDTTFSGLNTAIYQNDIVITAMQISDWWWTAPNGDTSWAAQDILPLRPVDATHPEVSGHCVNLYAYDEEQHYITNWWSAQWGYQGRGWYRINEAPAVYEAAIITYIAPTSPAPSAPIVQETVIESPIEALVSKVADFIEKVV